MDDVFGLESFELFSCATDEILNNLYCRKPKSDNSDDSHIIHAAKEDLKKLISHCKYDLTAVADSIKNRNWNERYVQHFLEQLETVKTELLYNTILQHNSVYGETVLDFDWVQKIIFGTNDLKSLRYPLLQLLLTTVNDNGEKKQIMYDINKDMLAKIIDVLENIEDKQ